MNPTHPVVLLRQHQRAFWFLCYHIKSFLDVEGFEARANPVSLYFAKLE